MCSVEALSAGARLRRQPQPANPADSHAPNKHPLTLQHTLRLHHPNILNHPTNKPKPWPPASPPRSAAPPSPVPPPPSPTTTPPPLSDVRSRPRNACRTPSLPPRPSASLWGLLGEREFYFLFVYARVHWGKKSRVCLEGEEDGWGAVDEHRVWRHWAYM
jgi:hypothetical protein